VVLAVELIMVLPIMARLVVVRLRFGPLHGSLLSRLVAVAGVAGLGLLGIVHAI